jgi:hypothetical protein
MTRKSSPSTDYGTAFPPPATTDDEKMKLRSGLTVPTPNSGIIETGLPTVFSAAHAAVETAIDDDGFSSISQSTGFKTTPFHLATATTTTALTTAHAAQGTTILLNPPTRRNLNPSSLTEPQHLRPSRTRTQCCSFRVRAPTQPGFY